jgi:acyl-CoA thioesterase
MTHQTGPRTSGSPTRASASPTRAEEFFARDPTCVALGLRLDDAGPGRASVRLRVADAMLNGHGIAHGGYLFLLADAAFAVASNSHGPTALAQGAQITFLRAVEAGEDLRAEAVERTRQGRVGVYDVTVRRADGAVVAEFRGQSTLLAAGRTHTAMEDQ